MDNIKRIICSASAACMLASAGAAHAQQAVPEVPGETSFEGSNTVHVAACNSSESDKAKAQFVCTGTHDEVTLQKAVDYISSGRLAGSGGQIKLFAGDYTIDDFPHEGHDTRAAVLLPSTAMNGRTFALGISGTDRNSENTRIRVSQAAYDGINDDGNRSIFASGPLKHYTHYSFTDLMLTIPDGKKNIICLDGREMGSMECRRIRCEVDRHSTWNTPTEQMNLPVEGCIAFCGCYFNSNTWSYVWDNCYALGFGQGFAVGGEHLVLFKCVAGYGLYGFTFNNYYKEGVDSRHQNTLIDITDEANANYWKFAANPARQTINVYDLNIEYWKNWFAVPGQGHFAMEENPGEWYGCINYQINRGFYTLPNIYDKFWEDGHGMNFHSRNNTHKPACTSEERREYYPTYGQTVFDTDIKKLLICTDTASRTWVDTDGKRHK